MLSPLEKIAARELTKRNFPDLDVDRLPFRVVSALLSPLDEAGLQQQLRQSVKELTCPNPNLLP